MPPVVSSYTPNTSIFSQIRMEQYDFFYNYVTVVPGYVFNQYYTVKRAHLYLNSQFENQASQTGKPRVFFNVVLPPCEVATKMLNLDTKNIRLWPMSPKSQFSTYLLEKELKYWLKHNKIGVLLNKIAEEAPRYGSVVVEKTPDGAELVDIRKLMLDPTVDRIQDSRFVTTIHYMTPTELRNAGWDENEVETAIRRFSNMVAQQSYEDKSGSLNRQQSTPYIKIHKRYGEVPAWWVDDSLKPGTKAGDKLVKSLFIVAGADEYLKNSDGIAMGEAGVVLFKSLWRKAWPFKDFHYTKTKGRWLGVGVPEMLFDVQVRVNELRNQTRLNMELASLNLFQTPDKSLVRNVLTDLENGDVLLSPNGIQPVQLANGNFLSAVEAESATYNAQVDKLSFAYEAIRGDQDPQSTLGQTQIAVAQGTSVFAFKKENLALIWQEFFNDLVMPQLMKDLTPDHIMRFTGSIQEVDKLDQAAAEIYANDWVKERMLNGELVFPQDEEMAKQKAIDQYKKLGESRFIKIKENFYRDAEFEFDFLITNEQANPSLMAQNIQTMLAQIPGIMPFINDPRVKLLFSKMGEQMGISPAEFDLADQQAQSAPQIQAPQPPQMPQQPVVPNIPQMQQMQTNPQPA